MLKGDCLRVGLLMAGASEAFGEAPDMPTTVTESLMLPGPISPIGAMMVRRKTHRCARRKVLFRLELAGQITLLSVPWSSNCGSLSVLTALPWPLNVTWR